MILKQSKLIQNSFIIIELQKLNDYIKKSIPNEDDFFQLRGKIMKLLEKISISYDK